MLNLENQINRALGVSKSIQPYTRGDPESPLKWTSKSTRKLAEALEEKGFKEGSFIVQLLLRSTCVLHSAWLHGLFWVS